MSKDKIASAEAEHPLLNVEEAIKMYKHLLKPNPNFGTDVYAHNFKSEGIVLIEDESTQSKGLPIRFDCYALILRLKGESRRSVDQYHYTIEPRSLQLINPGSLFSFQDISKSAKTFVLLFDKNFIMEDNLSKHALDSLLSFHQRHRENVQLDGSLYAQVLDIFEQINAEFRIKSSGYQNLMKMYINQLLYLLQREKEKLHKEKDIKRSEQICSNFLSLIEEHFEKKKKVYEYAELLDITPNHLSETIQQTLGNSALTYIHKRILKEMEFLLCHSSMSMKQIASKLSVDTASQLSRFFKHHKGVTPKEFRHKNQVN
ncbi:MAG: helix-turn-helix domain-containing protein [Campylobacterota bacterium]|nr:helix-turn-helix domain-containing protein [Campylobacterota bacterium]